MNRMKSKIIVLVGLCGVLVSASAAKTFETPAYGPQWLTYNNHLNGQRYSELKQIDATNVDTLGEGCRLQIDGPTGFSAALIVAEGVLYTTTAHQTVAMDAATCREIWRFGYTPDEKEIAATSRGVAVANGRVYRGTADGRLLALDAKTGNLLWRMAVGDPSLGEYVASAPQVWQGMVYTGIAGGTLGIRGRVMALDAENGRLIWRFNTIPMGDEVGADTWERADSARTGGGGTWTTFTLDTTTGELFIPVGNPAPQFSAAYRPGDNLFTSSLLVLDAQTGALKWWHQLSPGNDRDHDLGAAPVVYRDESGRDIAAFAGKDGYVQAVDRNTKELLFRVPITTIKGEELKLSSKPQLICPGAGGGTEFNGPALDRFSKSLITPAVDWCFEMSTEKAEYLPGQVFRGGRLKPGDTASGWLTAVDWMTGEVRWQYHSDFTMTAGVTPTASGITFTGDMGGNFLVFDSKTGKLLRKIETGGAIAGGVISYEIAGVQYVAISSGNVSRSTFGALGLPTVIVYKLGGNAAPATRESAGSDPAKKAVKLEAGDITRGGKKYSALCGSCHGPDGSAFPNVDLSTVAQRRDLSSLKAYIKDPKTPMPKLFPEILTEQDVADVAAYVHTELRGF